MLGAGHAGRRQGCRIPELVPAFVENKRNRGRSAVHLRLLEANLTLFARDFTCRVDELSRGQVEAWLDSRRVGPQRRNNLLADVISLVRFARRDGKLGADLTPAELIERKRLVIKIQTYSPAEFRKLLTAANPAWLPALGLGGFCLGEYLVDQRQGGRARCGFENTAAPVRRQLPRSLLLGERRGDRLPPSIVGSAIISRGSQRIRASRGSRTLQLAVTQNVAALSLELGNSPAMVFKALRRSQARGRGTRMVRSAPMNLALNGTFQAGFRDFPL